MPTRKPLTLPIKKEINWKKLNLKWLTSSIWIKILLVLLLDDDRRIIESDNDLLYYQSSIMHYTHYSIFISKFLFYLTHALISGNFSFLFMSYFWFLIFFLFLHKYKKKTKFNSKTIYINTFWYDFKIQNNIFIYFLLFCMWSFNVNESFFILLLFLK